jgi:hypothetical protein
MKAYWHKYVPSCPNCRKAVTDISVSFSAASAAKFEGRCSDCRATLIWTTGFADIIKDCRLLDFEVYVQPEGEEPNWIQ